VAVTGTVRVSDPAYARQLALAGLGVAYVLEPLVHADLAAGRLLEVLPEASVLEPGLFVYFPQRAAWASKLRAFLDVIRDLNAGSGFR
jgi:DNA-binding transcriptional LysR family regulator